MKNTITFIDWGRRGYAQAWKDQEEIFNKQIERKKNGIPTSNTLIFVEHPHVYTLGKSGDPQNLLVTENMLKNINAEFYRVNRGGDITYHGPGQIVGYPIIDLERFGLHYKGYISKLEETIIRFLLAEYGIASFHSDDATGVWLGSPPRLRKICSIGTRGSRYITMHGFALNVNTDLAYFHHINPCGYTTRDMTSIEKESGSPVDMEHAKRQLLAHFANVFEAEIV
ncbi:MAG: lipoyl(octanoyl) transferase LipB [Bacteroidales bacterium]|jgi:lipoyl(octanoyl) transferase|nr:lipoyl(octanoyl) transferase LipB [Bacteroidales bacterium]